MRVGLYGGSFNPAHEGHAHVANTALKRLGLDRLIWLVSPQNPLKSHTDTADLNTRIGGVKAWARPARMTVSDIERRLGLQFTIDTVRTLKARFPGVHFVWVMGADSLGDFHRWRGWTRIMRELPIAVVARPGLCRESRLSPAARRFSGARRSAAFASHLAGTPPPAWVYLPAPLNFATSTRLRNGG